MTCTDNIVRILVIKPRLDVKDDKFVNETILRALVADAFTPEIYYSTSHLG